MMSFAASRLTSLLSRPHLTRSISGAGIQPPPAPSSVDPSFRRIMVYLFVGSRGGHNRVTIVESLRAEPSNANQLALKLGLDYKTVQHHLKLLEQNGVIVPSAQGSYGAIFFLTPYFDKHFDSVREMWTRFGQTKK